MHESGIEHIILFELRYDPLNDFLLVSWLHLSKGLLQRDGRLNLVDSLLVKALVVERGHFMKN